MNILDRLLAFARQAWTTTGFALKRLLTQRLLGAAALVGLVIASSFIFSVPLYADAIYFRLFREELFSNNKILLETSPVDYAPLDFTYEQRGVGQGNPQWEDAVKADAYLTGDAIRLTGLPLMKEIRRFHTDFLYLYPSPASENANTDYFLGTMRIAFITPLNEAVEIVHGSAPKPSTLLGDGSIEVLVSETFALEAGVQVGDQDFLRRDDLEIPVTIVGLWREKNPDAPYWDGQSSTWLLVDETTYTGAVSNAVDDELFSGMWNIQLSGSRLFASDIAGLKDSIQTVNQRVDILLPQTKLIQSPLEALGRYQKNTPSLTFLLFAFSVPIMGLIVVFIGLVTGLFVGEQRSEMAVLRSRGASRLQVGWISLLQGILLAVVALTGGALLGIWIAHAIGRAHSFLNFSGTDGLRIGMTSAVLGYGVLGIALILLVLIMAPTIGAAANTIISYKRERARILQRPWWQRFWVDLLLLIPAAYGFWTLNRQSRQAASGAEGIPNPLQNPLLLLVPAIGHLCRVASGAADHPAGDGVHQPGAARDEKRRHADGGPLPLAHTGVLHRAADPAHPDPRALGLHRIAGPHPRQPAGKADVLSGRFGYVGRGNRHDSNLADLARRRVHVPAGGGASLHPGRESGHPRRALSGHLDLHRRRRGRNVPRDRPPDLPRRRVLAAGFRAAIAGRADE